MSMGACSPWWEARCTSRKSLRRRSLPRRRRSTLSIRTRAVRFRRTSAPLSPASSKPAAGIHSCSVGSLIESSHAMPAETRGTLAGALALADIPEARAAAVLFLLDPDLSVRRAVAAALAQVATSLTPIEVRRLIAMRNWRPENERAEVDAVIRKARGAGIDCAQWEAGSIETILATSIDGAATQGFLLVIAGGRKKQIRRS